MDNQPAGHHLKVRGIPLRSDNSPHPRPPAVISMTTHHNPARPHTPSNGHRLHRGHLLSPRQPFRTRGPSTRVPCELPATMAARQTHSHRLLVRSCLDDCPQSRKRTVTGARTGRWRSSKSAASNHRRGIGRWTVTDAGHLRSRRRGETPHERGTGPASSVDSDSRFPAKPRQSPSQRCDRKTRRG